MSEINPIANIASRGAVTLGLRKRRNRNAYDQPEDVAARLVVTDLFELSGCVVADEVAQRLLVQRELAKLKPSSAPYKGKPQGLAPVNGSPTDKITMAALYPRYAAFLRAGDTVVLETGSSSLGVTPTILPDGVRLEAQVLWGSIGWATPAAFGVALADRSRRTILITGEGSHQLTANDIGAMGRFGANVIVFVLNNNGYLIERALEPNPNWTYNDLAPWSLSPTRAGRDATKSRL